MKWYAHFADELPALEYKDTEREAWEDANQRREIDDVDDRGRPKNSSIITKRVIEATLGDFFPSRESFVGLMRERMVEMIGNDDAFDGNEEFGAELDKLIAEDFRELLNIVADRVGMRIDGDIVVAQHSYRPGQEPKT